MLDETPQSKEWVDAEPGWPTTILYAVVRVAEAGDYWVGHGWGSRRKLSSTVLPQSKNSGMDACQAFPQPTPQLAVEL